MQKLKNIECFRFIFAIVIAYMHMIIGWHKLYPANDSITYLASAAGWGNICVDFFFIIAGYFLYYSIEKTSDIFSLAVHKLKRLYPVFAFSIIAPMLIHKFHISEIILNLLLLQNTGICLTKGINVAAWFVSALFLISIFYAFIIKIFSERQRLFIILISTFCSYSILVQENCFYPKEMVTPILTSGILRAVAGIGCGYLLAVFYKRSSKSLCRFFNSNFYTKIILSIVEIILSGTIIYLIISGKHLLKNPFALIVLFVFLFILLLSKSGFLSRLLENDISVFLGKYAYSIYLMQAFYNILARNFLWGWGLYAPESLSLAIFLNILNYIILGVITYHVVEKPFNNYFKRTEKLDKQCTNQ